MTIRTVTGNIADLAGISIPNATFSLVPETFVFGSDSSVAVFGDMVTVEADANGDVSFNIHEGKYLGRISTTQGPKNFRLVVDVEGPWTLGRLLENLGGISSSIAAQIFEAVERAEGYVQDASDFADLAADNSRLGIGTVLTRNPGTAASADIVGDPGEQLLNLEIPRGAEGEPGPKGDTGDRGPKGEKGDTGTAVTIIGSFSDPADLPTTGNEGDAYLIEGDIWVWTGAEWLNVGRIQGPRGAGVNIRATETHIQWAPESGDPILDTNDEPIITADGTALLDATEEVWRDIIAFSELKGDPGEDAPEQSFPSVAAMKADTDLKVGDFVKTIGYHYPGDGGAATYEIVSAGTGTDDGGLFHDLDSGLAQAKLVYGWGIKAEWFGVTLPQDGVPVDRTDAFNLAFATAADMSRRARRDPEPNIWFTCASDFLASGTLHLRKSGGAPCEVHVDVSGKITATTGGEFEQHYSGGYLDNGVPVEETAPLPLINFRVRRSHVRFADLDCNFLCSGVRYDQATGATSWGKDLINFRKYGLLVLDKGNNALVLRWNNVKQWMISPDAAHDFDGRMAVGGNNNAANYTGDCYVAMQKDHRLWGGHYGWSRSALLLLDQYPRRDTIGEDKYYDGLSNDSNKIETSAGTGDVYMYGVHIMQGSGESPTGPRYDNIYLGGPIGLECYNTVNPAFGIGLDIDACTIQLFGGQIKLFDCSYISGGQNKFPDDNGQNADRVITVDPRVRVYADGTNNPSGTNLMNCPGITVGVYPRAGYPDFDGDYSAWNMLQQPKGATKTTTFAKFLAFDGDGRSARGLDVSNCSLQAPVNSDEGDLYLVVQDMDVLDDNSVVLRGAGGSVQFPLNRGDYVIITEDYSGNGDRNWLPGKMVRAEYTDVDGRSGTYQTEFRRTSYVQWGRDANNEPIEQHYKPGGSIGYTFDLAGSTMSTSWDGATYTIDAGIVNLTGVLTLEQYSSEPNAVGYSIAASDGTASTNGFGDGGPGLYFKRAGSWIKFT